MKRITKILVSVLVVAAIAACGAKSRDGRSAFSTDASAEAAIDSDINLATTSVYKLTIGSDSSTAAIPTSTLLSYYGIDIAVLGLSQDGKVLAPSVTFLEFGIGVDKSTGRCGMYTYVNFPDGSSLQVEPHYVGTTNSIYSSSDGIITCTATDGISTIVIQIINQSASTALVTVIDQTYGTLFTKAQTMTISSAAN